MADNRERHDHPPQQPLYLANIVWFPMQNPNIHQHIMGRLGRPAPFHVYAPGYNANGIMDLRRYGAGAPDMQRVMMPPPQARPFQQQQQQQPPRMAVQQNQQHLFYPLPVLANRYAPFPQQPPPMMVVPQNIPLTPQAQQNVGNNNNNGRRFSQRLRNIAARGQNSNGRGTQRAQQPSIRRRNSAIQPARENQGSSSSCRCNGKANRGRGKKTTKAV